MAIKRMLFPSLPGSTGKIQVNLVTRRIFVTEIARKSLQIMQPRTITKHIAIWAITKFKQKNDSTNITSNDIRLVPMLIISMLKEKRTSSTLRLTIGSFLLNKIWLGVFLVNSLNFSLKQGKFLPVEDSQDTSQHIGDEKHWEHICECCYIMCFLSVLCCLATHYLAYVTVFWIPPFIVRGTIGKKFFVLAMACIIMVRKLPFVLVVHFINTRDNFKKSFRFWYCQWMVFY